MSNCSKTKPIKNREKKIYLSPIITILPILSPTTLHTMVNMQRYKYN